MEGVSQMSRSAASYYEDGIISFGIWQFSNSVNRNDLPTAAWGPVWHKLPHLLCQERLAAVAGIAPCYIAGSIAGDAQPQIIVKDQL